MSTATLGTKSSKARDPQTVQLSQRSATEYGALSSNGLDIYTVRKVRGAWVCQCKGYAARQTCCHSTAAEQARTCEHCAHTGADVDMFVNGWDNGSAITLCTDRPACAARQGVA